MIYWIKNKGALTYRLYWYLLLLLVSVTHCSVSSIDLYNYQFDCYIHIFISICFIYYRENPCYLTRQEALKITLDIVQNPDVEANEDLIFSIQDKLLTVLHSERDMFKCQGHVYIPGFSDFLITVGTITIAMCLKGDNSMVKDGNLIHFEIESILLLLLNSTCYEVRIMSLRFVKLFFKMENEDEEDQSDSNVDEDIYRMITKCDKEYKDNVCLSTRILEKCLQMAMEEECHHECLYEVMIIRFHPPIFTVWIHV